jgi:hypothetical protein
VQGPKFKPIPPLPRKTKMREQKPVEEWVVKIPIRGYLAFPRM